MPTPINKFVKINFTLKDDSGEILDSSNDNEPFIFITGKNHVIPGLEAAIDGMLIGSKKSIVLEPSEAYGDLDESAFQIVKKTQFPAGSEINIGDEFVANANDGVKLPFVISEINGEDITLDFNHPLAGQKLFFDIELLDMRDATLEELAALDKESAE